MKTNKKNEVRLYNLLFPVWVLIFVPSMWLVVLPANFAIDSAVVLLTLLYLRRHAADCAAGATGADRADPPASPDAPAAPASPAEAPLWKEWLRCILPVWLIGFASDLVGAGFMIFWGYLPGLLAGGTAFGTWWEERITDPLSSNPFNSIPALLFAMLGVALAALLIYRLNSRLSFRRLSLDDEQRRQLALSLAVFTAPYVMLLPSEWFWGMQM